MRHTPNGVGPKWTKPHFDIPIDGEFQNEAWPSLDQLNVWFGAPPTFHSPPLSFEYLARQKCILSFGGDGKLQWGTLKSVQITQIPRLADISFKIIKYLLGQVIKVYRIKCPPSGELG